MYIPCTRALPLTFIQSVVIKMEYNGIGTGGQAGSYSPAQGRFGVHTKSGAFRNGDRRPPMVGQPASKRQRTNTSSASAAIYGRNSSCPGFFSPNQSPQPPSSIISPDRLIADDVNSRSSAIQLFQTDEKTMTTTHLPADGISPTPEHMMNMGAMTPMTMTAMPITQDAAVSDVDDSSHCHQTPVEWWKQRPVHSSDHDVSGSGNQNRTTSVIKCHVCNQNDAPTLDQSAAVAGNMTGQYNTMANPWQNCSSSASYTTTGNSMAASTSTGYVSQQQQQQPVRKQKNSLLSYFQVRHAPTQTSDTAVATAGNPSPAPLGSTILTCSYCERPSCLTCTRNCESCLKRYCTFCSTVNYDEAREERVFCLDCDAAAAAASASAHGDMGECMDMEE